MKKSNEDKNQKKSKLKTGLPKGAKNKKKKVENDELRLENPKQKRGRPQKVKG